MPIVSSHRFAVSPSGASSEPNQSEANAPPPVKGNAPVLTCAPRYRNKVATTRKIMNRISQAPRVCEPKNRDSRPCFAGLYLTRRIAKVTIPISTNTENRSSAKPTTGQVPTSGMWKSATNSAPYVSRIVSVSTRKPQNANTCATPGTVHFSSLRWPSTSNASAWTRLGASSNLPTAGLPEPANRNRNDRRLPAKNRIRTVIATPTTARSNMCEVMARVYGRANPASPQDAKAPSAVGQRVDRVWLSGEIDITCAWNRHNAPFVHVVDMDPQQALPFTPKGGSRAHL